MAAAAVAVPLLLLLVLLSGVAAQLPNLRTGLPVEEDAARQINNQPGYEVRDYDLPFGERFLVNFKYYSDLPDEPQLYRHNPPRDVACCYNFNAFWTANVALHPYWFREFGLERMCRQDVCLSIWTQDHAHDLMWKVTDVCDPADCPTPLDVKIEAHKGKYLWYGARGPRPSGPAYAYFTKCWADGLAQPDLVSTLPGPPLRNSRHWMIKTTTEQWRNNQAANKVAGRPMRPLGILVRPEATQYSAPGFKASDWPPGSGASVKPPSWCAGQQKRGQQQQQHAGGSSPDKDRVAREAGAKSQKQQG